jgi:hypothetical protein
LLDRWEAAVDLDLGSLHVQLQLEVAEVPAVLSFGALDDEGVALLRGGDALG